jgi:hypothetical protein
VLHFHPDFQKKPNSLSEVGILMKLMVPSGKSELLTKAEAKSGVYAQHFRSEQDWNF